MVLNEEAVNQETVRDDLMSTSVRSYGISITMPFRCKWLHTVLAEIKEHCKRFSPYVTCNTF